MTRISWSWAPAQSWRSKYELALTAVLCGLGRRIKHRDDYSPLSPSLWAQVWHVVLWNSDQSCEQCACACVSKPEQRAFVSSRANRCKQIGPPPPLNSSKTREPKIAKIKIGEKERAAEWTITHPFPESLLDVILVGNMLLHLGLSSRSFRAHFASRQWVFLFFFFVLFLRSCRIHHHHHHRGCQVAFAFLEMCEKKIQFAAASNWVEWWSVPRLCLNY